MKMFQLTQKNLATLGISLHLTLQPHPFKTKIVLGFLITTSYITCNLVYIIFEAETFTECTQSIYMGSGAIMIFFCLAIIILNVKKLFQLIECCENLSNTTLKYSASKSIFNKTVQFEGKLSRILFDVMLIVTPICGFAPWMIYIYFIYFTTDLGNAAFELPFPIWLPFDWKNPCGFSIAIAVQYMMLSYTLKIAACVIVFGIGIYLYIIASSEWIKQSLFAISQCIRNETKTEWRFIWGRFIEYIELDSCAKRLTNNTSDIYQQFCTCLFLWSLVTICGALLMIQLQIVHQGDNLTTLLITVFQIIYAFGMMSTIYELCQQINVAFDECNDIINQFEWYLMPAEIQRMLPFIIQFAQQPVNINCFGSHACDREAFKYVIKSAFSYFMVLREFL